MMPRGYKFSLPFSLIYYVHIYALLVNSTDQPRTLLITEDIPLNAHFIELVYCMLKPEFSTPTLQTEKEYNLWSNLEMQRTDC